MKTRNRLLAAMLALVMIISMLPISAFAEGGNPALPGYGENNNDPGTITHTVAITGVDSTYATVSGAGTYNHGETATVRFAFKEGWTGAFSGWCVNGGKATGDMEYAFTVTEDVTLTPKYLVGNDTVGVLPSGGGGKEGKPGLPGYGENNNDPGTTTYPVTLVCDPTDGGSITITGSSPTTGGKESFAEGETVNLKIMANSGYTFKYNDLTVNGEPVTNAIPDLFGGGYTASFKMPAEAVTVKATFTVGGSILKRYTVSVTGGTVGDGLLLDNGRFNEGDIVTISASYAPIFKEWSGAEGLTFTSGSATSSTASFKMPARNVTLTATYNKNVYPVTLNCEPTGGGSITIMFQSPSTGGVESFAEGETVSLNIRAYHYRVLKSLTVNGEPVSATPSPIDEQAYSASFTMPDEAVTVEATFEGGDPVTVIGIKLNSDNAKKDYTVGDNLDVTGMTIEVSKSGGSWETVYVTAGMVSGFDSSKLGKQTLTVTYEGFTDTYEIEVKAPVTPPVTPTGFTILCSVYPAGGGTLRIRDWTGGHAPDGQTTFPPGYTGFFDIQTNEGEGYSFNRLEVNGVKVDVHDNPAAGALTYYFTVQSNMTAVAYFDGGGGSIPTYTVRVQADPAAGGSVEVFSATQLGLSFINVFQGYSATVKATPNEGYVFAGWYDGTTMVSTEDSYTFTPTDSITLTAKFVEPYPLWIGDTQVHPGNKDNIPGVTGENAKASFDPSTNTLTLENVTGVTGSTGGALITAEGINLTVEGDAVLEDDSVAMGIQAAPGSLTLDGDFTISADSYGIYVQKDVTVAGGNIFSEGGACGVYSARGTLKVNSGTLETTGSMWALWPTLDISGYSPAPDVLVNTVPSTTPAAAWNNSDDLTGFQYVKISPVSYTVTLSTKPAEGGTVSGGGTYAAGTEITVCATENEGYFFTQWVENGNFANANETYTFTVERDRVLTAEFQKYQVAPSPTGISLNNNGAKQFYRQGEELDTTGLSLTVSYSSGDHHTLSVMPSMVSGFDSSRIGKQTLTVSFVGHTDTYEVTVVGANDPIGHTITLDANGVSVTNIPSSVKTDAYGRITQALPTPYPQEMQYRFIGWFLMPSNFMGMEVRTGTDGTVFQNDASIYACWREEPPVIPGTQYRVSITGGRRGFVFAEAGETVWLEAMMPSRFYKWEVVPDSVTLADPYAYTTSFTMPSTNVTATAIFKHSVTLTGSPAEGGTVTGSGNYIGNESATVTATPNEGYVFAGWYNGNALVSTENTYTFTPTNNITLTAKFSSVQSGKIKTKLFVKTGPTVVDPSETAYFAFIPITEDGDPLPENTVKETQLTVPSQGTFTLEEYNSCMMEIPASALSPGENTLQVGWAGDDTYEGCSETITFTVANKSSLKLTDYTETLGLPGEPYTISGRFLDENDNPLSNTEITIRTQQEPGSESMLPWFVDTDADGRFSFTMNQNLSFIHEGDTLNIEIIVHATDTYLRFEQTKQLRFSTAPATYTVALTANREGAGQLEGGGTYTAGTEVTVKATHYTSYVFDGWYDKDGNKVSDGVREGSSSTYTYTFTATENVNLTAKFKFLSSISASTIDGKYVYGEGDQIYIQFDLTSANGNLPYSEKQRVTLTLDGEKIGTWNTLLNQFRVSSLPSGKNALVLNYPGNDDHSAQSCYLYITIVNKLSLRLVDFKPEYSPLNKPYTISGYIMDENSNRCANTDVYIGVQRNENGNMYENFKTTTDNNGYFSYEIASLLPTTESKRNIQILVIATDAHRGLNQNRTIQFTDSIPHTVVIVNGAPSKGEAMKGETIEITADEAPGNMQFDKWKIIKGDVELTDENSTPTTFNMPDEDVEIAATYKSNPAPTAKHTVTFILENGAWITSDGNESQVSITVDDGHTLTAADLPGGKLADDGYGVGKWDTNPVGVTVDGDKTFTWTYLHYKISFNTQGKGTAPAQTESVNSGSSGNGSPDVEWYGSAADQPVQSGDDLYRVYDKAGRVWFTDPADDSTAVNSDTPIGADTTLYCKWVQGDKVVDAVSLSVFPKAGDTIPTDHWYPGGEWGELSAQFVRANGTDYEVGAVNWDNPDGDDVFVAGKTYEVRVQVSTGDMESSRTFLKGHATVQFDSNYAITNPEVCYALSVDGAASAEIDYVQPTESFVTIRYTVPAAPQPDTLEADPTSLDFGTEQAGYDTITPKPVTLRNDTGRNITVKSLSGAASYDVMLLTAGGVPIPDADLPYTLATGESVNIAVHPKSGLAAGDYNETLTITYNDGADKTLSVQLDFTVAEDPNAPLYDLSATIDPTEGGTVTFKKKDGAEVTHAQEGDDLTVSWKPEIGFDYGNFFLT
ncbi:MAG: bacterial Ig-like domain-containing protein, partial [Clostridia bacterium]|nr:bacterial Ig-like domain-containing protein [Clostridia bacterium]